MAATRYQRSRVRKERNENITLFNKQWKQLNGKSKRRRSGQIFKAK